MLYRFKISKVTLTYFSAFLLMLVPSSPKAEPTMEQFAEQYTYQPFIKEKAFVRRAKGMNGVGVFGGMASIGPIAGVEWSYQLFLSSSLKVLAGIERKTHPYVAYKSIFLQPMLYRTAFTNYRNSCFNIGIGAVLVHIKKYDGLYEGSQKRTVKKENSNLNLGLTVSGEIEVYVFKTVEVTLAGGPIIYLFKDEYDRISYYLSLGVKLNF